jgi:hypothetical protein
MEKISSPTNKATPKLLKVGIHPGFDHLSPEVNVCRCKLWPAANKPNKDSADYIGKLWLIPEKVAARVFLWVHSDGTLGLRVQKLKRPKSKSALPPPAPPADTTYTSALTKLEALKSRKKQSRS